MKELFGLALLKLTDKPLTLTTPEELIGRIIIFVKTWFLNAKIDLKLVIFPFFQGKKFGADQADDGGEVTDEDEGAETNRNRASRGGVGPVTRRRRICRELSDLIALNRGSSTKLPSSRDKSKVFFYTT